ncbi:MAG: hypothetical protein AAGE84_10040 [Cyanobacteria bacterium P01_G01_bin.39]
MNKTEAILLLNHEGWTKADAQRALAVISFKVDHDVDELTVLRTASKFAGVELLNRQRLQAAQKGMVTKRNKEIQQYIVEVEELTRKIGSSSNNNPKEIEKGVQRLKDKISNLVLEKNDLEQEKSHLENVKRDLEKDNKYLTNIVH